MDINGEELQAREMVYQQMFTEVVCRQVVKDQKDALNWSEVTVKAFWCYKIFLFKLNSVLLNFYFYQRIKKYYNLCITITIIFNIMKYFLNTKSAY